MGSVGVGSVGMGVILAMPAGAPFPILMDEATLSFRLALVT